MAYDNNQTEQPLPSDGNEKRKSETFLPKFFRTTPNQKFLSSTVDQLIQPGVVEKLNGYIGRETAKAFTPSDNYVGDVSKSRFDYQLEPAAVIKDNLGNVDFYKDYNDYMNQLSNANLNNKDHSVVNQQEYYAWNPHIDWDKFANFREYYWLPLGPQTIGIAGNTIDVDSTYTVRIADNIDNNAYLFSPDGLTQNPTITLYRGITYRFDIDTPSLPFTIKTKKTLDEGFELDSSSILVLEGVSVQGLEKGVSTLQLGLDTPDILYYMASNDLNAAGTIIVKDIAEATFIDVEKEIVGKKQYKSSNGINLSNGMKIEFTGEVSPSKYADTAFYVEGVGDKIKLIAEDDLNVPTAFTEDIDVEFDAQGFDRLPYSKAIGYPEDKDYLVINRSSQDGNLWSRYNRWFHKSVIEESAKANGQTTDIDQLQRAKRPIIEFEPNLKLFNFGTKSKADVDLVDDYTKDVFSTIEGSSGYNIDSTDVADGMRILFTADTDPLVQGRIFKVNFINFASGATTNRQIHLIEESDGVPQEKEVVLVKNGAEYKGKLLHYHDGSWIRAQDKTKENQAPLFDIFDENGNSYSDASVYESTTFVGNKIFSYKEGTGTLDSEIGIPISYRSIQNVGDIVFNFNLLQDSITYTANNNAFTKNTDIGFLRQYNSLTDFTVHTGWKKVSTKSEQTVIRQYVFDNTSTGFEVDVYDNSGLLEDLWIRVYLNGKRQFEGTDFTITNNIQNIAEINFANTLNINDVILIKTKSAAVKNDNGYYEIPASLERNPQNENITEFTLGEVNDHVATIVEQADDFVGEFPGSGNLRDLGQITEYGRRFLQHSVPLNLPLYHLTDTNSNVLKSIDYARKTYSTFKRVFLQTAEELGFQGTTKEHVDKILQEINKNKNKSEAFFFSDMVPIGATKKITRIIDDVDDLYFPISEVFDLETPSRKAVQVYINGQQLVHGKDYTFNAEGYVLITATKQQDDVVDIYEYETTNGSYIPPTPSKLGLYPAYEPVKYTDNTFITPTDVIQGHDGSRLVAFGDYRDDLLLELEKRIYNNIKVKYDSSLLNIHALIGSDNRNTSVSKKDIDNCILTDFIKWTKLIDQDYTLHNFFERTNRFTFNYSRSTNKNDELLPGFWREIYRKAFDTDRPHTHPWEMLGFTVMPKWWEDQYGPAPYTKQNLLLWQDIENGIVREPNKKFITKKDYARPNLTNHIPVDSEGNLLSPLDCGYVKFFDPEGIAESFIFGDGSPVENAWRTSSEFPFSIIKAYAINKPQMLFATGFDRINQIRNIANEIVYKTTSKRITLNDIVFPNTSEDTVQNYTSGLINYISNYLSTKVLDQYSTYKNNLRNIKNQLGYKLSGFTDKDKFRLILDSRTPTNEGNVFVPDENYKIFLNTSSPIEIVSYSGVIIERRSDGYVVKGYDNEISSFKVYQAVSTQNDPSINIGGISESYLIWTENKSYVVGTNVEYQGSYYRVKENHQSTESFDTSKFAKLPSLPLVGGRNAFVRKQFNKNVIIDVPYGTLFTKIQDVVDFLLGYGEFLKDKGFVFDYYEGNEKVLLDFRHSVNEFLFWTTQKWGEGSVITLSPASSQLKFKSEYSMVDNIFDGFYGYSLYKADGNKLVEEFSSIGRSPNEFILRPKNTADGIYAVKLPLVQKEHVLLIDNKTVFGDVIFDTQPGYRQERIKVLGYVTQDWDGSLNIPGFIYDDAKVKDWQSWTDYAIGDVVKYKEFYYSAIYKISGTQDFDANDWFRLEGKPETGLLSNFEYKTNQFADFYDLDSDNFDTEQQKIAQHLIGYQKRQYLENIINDDVSQYKFYQGMLQDKGTKNSLTKLFDVLSSADKDSLEFYEEWAIKDGQYGASEGFEEFELLLDENQFRLSPQPILLSNSRTGKETDLIYRILPYEVYQKTKNYNHKPFPETVVNSSYVKNAGYVNQSDVKGIATRYENIIDFRFSDIRKGEYIWVGNDKLDWGVYQHLDTDYRVESVQQGTTEFTITLTSNVNDMTVGNVIGLHDTGNTALDKFFLITKIDKNVITLSTNTAVTEIENCDANITKFVKVRSNNITDANIVLQKNLEENDLHWIDNFSENLWAVVKNTNNLKEQLRIERDSSSNDLSYGTAISADERNTTLVVGAPDENDGKVYVYTRATESINYILAQVILPTKYGDDNERFGASVAVSPDANYIIVGSPNASNLKTKYAGDFVATTNYSKNSIVRAEQQLWRSVVDIAGQVDNIEFNSFKSITQIIDNLNVENLSSVNIPILLVGNYAIDTITDQFAFQNVPVDHLLLRAPKELYEGSGVNDSIKIAWNQITYSNQGLAALAERSPFENSFSNIDAAFLELEHTIQKKVDVILYVNGSTNLPLLGDTLQTQTGSGIVDYIYNEGAELVLYLRDVNGSFNSADSLFRSDGDFIGEYVKQGPVDSVDTDDELGGFWWIDTPQYTPTNSTTNLDQGRGIVYYDVISDSTPTGRYYYNSLDYDTTVLNSQNTYNSYIRVLSSQGLPGAYGNNDEILSNLYVVRAPSDVSNIVSQGDTVNLYVNQLPQYGTGIVKDITTINLNTTITNKLQTIYDVWDGYINLNYTKFDSGGNPFEPKIGQTVEDLNTGATGTVAFYQRDGLNATIFIKNMVGTFSQGDQFGQNAEIEFKLISGDPNPTYQADRVMGQIQFVGLGLPSEGIGKLLVFEAPNNIQIPAIDNILDAEYWLYTAGTVLGIPRAANAPSAINNEWEAVYQIPAQATGTASGLTNEGSYAIYSKATFGRYDLINVYTVPEKQNNFKLGSDVKITLNNNLYRGMIHAAGNGTTSLPGRIYFIKYGEENNLSYAWDYAKNKRFKGVFSETVNYFTNDIVYLDQTQGTLYTAKTNLAPGAFNFNDWTSTDDVVDYVGYIPNSTGLSVVNDSTILPTVLDQDGLIDFGSQFDVAVSGEVLITNAIYNNAENKVVVYRSNRGHFERSQEIDAPDTTSGFGKSIAISDDGTMIAISAPYNDDYKLDQGLIYIYKQVNGTFTQSQILQSPNNERGEQFGWKIHFDGEKLFVSSKNADAKTKTIFDSGETVLDSNFTTFTTVNDDSGIVYVYEKVDQELLFAQRIQIPDADVNYFGRNTFAKNNHFYIGLPNKVSNSRQGMIIDFKHDRNMPIWQYHRQVKPTVNIDKIKKMFLYDTKSNELLTYLDYIDPIQGKVAGVAEQELTYKTYYDPAVYDFISGTDKTTFDPTNSWGEAHVGEVWWNLTNAKFYNPYQGDVIYSTQNWSKVFQGNTIDVYEWVESDVIPSQWDAKADTENGFAKGYSGTSLYGDSTYSIRKTYDDVAKIFKTKYYFWVKNKKTVPNVEFRNINISDIADYIKDPIAKGYMFAGLISADSFVLYNVERYIKGKDVALSTQFWTIENQNQNIHNQYQIISEGLETSQPNPDIVRKWFDSLVGYDEQDRAVPDPALSEKQKYGALNRPRQSWFKNRYEALKQVIERANLVLAENLIIDDKIITPLNDADPQPTLVSRHYDVKVDSIEDLEFIGVAKAAQAILTPTVLNGKIVSVEITNPGRGYRIAPTVVVNGDGEGAVITTTIDNLGKVIEATIEEAGENYAANTSLTVRRFTALVESDSTILGKWALYERISENRTWNRIKSQAYDVKLFWDYSDWYANGYSEITDIDYLIDNSYELTGLDNPIGSIVKISNVGTGGWLLLEKEDDQDTEDYTLNYKTIGRQNGTIKFSENLYDSERAFTGFDTISFDTKIYDNEPRIELRTILNTIKNNLFIDDLQVKFNDLFFASLRYAFSEQTYIDWAFKTSFIKAKHNVGSLRKDITFNNDSLPSYEQYIKEVKPFGTKIREYLSSYEGLDNSSTLVTDFDLPPSYNRVDGKIIPANVKVQSDTLVGVNTDIESYPNRNWLDNSSLKVIKVEVVNPGSGYRSPPVLTLSGGGGSGAEIKATIGTNGKVTGVSVVNQGSGYYSLPTIKSLDNITDDGTPATYSIQLGGSPVRGLHTIVKFDRTTGTYVYTDLNKSETFTASGSKFEFTLTWPMNLDKNTVNVFVNNVEALDSEYTFTNTLDTSKGYDRYFGQINFVNLPDKNDIIRIEYKLSIDAMHAHDRINNFIPKTGNYITDLNQLMKGLDYGGVEISSFDFGKGRGWDNDTWFEDSYDTYDDTFEDEIFELGDSTTLFTFAKPLENGVEYHVYRNNIRIDDPNFGTEDPVTNPNAIMQSITGAGQTSWARTDDDYSVDNLFTFDEEQVAFSNTDTVIFRKSTSDGTFLPDPTSYDSLIQGGALNYSTATGLRAEDINIDGDGFVTPTTSGGPEELVPGQVVDTVDIKVYERPRGGASEIISRNFIGDGITKTYSFENAVIQKYNLFVKINYVIINETDYTIDYDAKTITFNSAPAVGTRINLTLLGVSGVKIIDIDNFVADGSTSRFLTNVRFASDLQSIITLNGDKLENVVVKSRKTDGISGNALIKFAVPPAAGSVINFAFFEGGDIQNYSEVSIDTFTLDGSTLNYDLKQTPFKAEPAAWRTIVKVNDKILNAGYSQSFVMAAATREYELDNFQVPPGATSNKGLKVFVNDTQLTYLSDWTFTGASGSAGGSIVRIKTGVNHQDGDILKVYLVNDGEYAFGYIDNAGEFVDTPGTIYLDQAYSEDDTLTVYQFSNHDSQGLERIQFDVVDRITLTAGTDDWYKYNHLTAGLIELNRPAIDAEYVWVTLNGNLLIPSVHYNVTDNKKYVKINISVVENDVVEIIHFAASKTTNKYGWRQFKDMLNRTHYKRLDDTAGIKLATELNWYDQKITVTDASTLPAPDATSNVPGIIFIDGERIEYFVKNNNVLSQLRRGTLGTGVKNVYPADTIVINQGQSSTMPYKDETLTTQFIADGTSNTYTLDFIANNVNEFEVFVAGKRLRKNAIGAYQFEERDSSGNVITQMIAQDSPEGDITLPAEYSVDGTTLTLTSTPSENVKVIVVRRKGVLWSDPGTPLGDSESDIAKFLRAATVDLPR